MYIISFSTIFCIYCYLLFTPYTANLISNVQRNFPEISCHCYADDTQLYVSFRPDEHAKERCVSLLETCVDYERGWMLQNRLMLNDGKTDLMIIGTPKQTSKLNLNSVSIGDSVIEPSVSARNLGVQFDAYLNTREHITYACKSAYYMIYNIRRIRKYLDKDITKDIVHACIPNKLDYCNGLLYGIPDSQIVRLQRVQSTCARLIFGCSKFTRITPILTNLHCLQVRQRITFKILLIVYKHFLVKLPIISKNC